MLLQNKTEPRQIVLFIAINSRLTIKLHDRGNFYPHPGHISRFPRHFQGFYITGLLQTLADYQYEIKT